MYTILTTCPPYGSQNVGDKLIEQRTKDLVTAEKQDSDFLTIFREEPLDEHLAEVNSTRAVLMPAFPIRDTPMHPGTYRLVSDLARIRVPLIPIGANWNVYPGDRRSRREVWYSRETTRFLKYVAENVAAVSCREYYTADVLNTHGIYNTAMTGDPAWFLLSAVGRPMRRPSSVDSFVFSPPLSPFYVEQAKQVMATAKALFPTAQAYCAFHLFDSSSTAAEDAPRENSAAMSADVTTKNRRIKEYAEELGYEIREMAGDLANLELYENCRLHVGYECHAHLNFISRRIPSVLIAEDARGVGFNYTLGVGGVDGFVRAQRAVESEQKTITSGYCTSLAELAVAPPRTDVHLEIRDFLRHELDSGFRRYIGLADYLDDVFENRMRPFIRDLP